MTWVRLDDTFDENPKVERAGPLAAHVYICGLTYAARNLTDGFIPADKALRLVGLPRMKALVAALVEVGLWEPATGGYQIHDWDHYNPPAARVREQRRQSAERQARWRETRLETVNTETNNAVTGCVTNAECNAVTNGRGDALVTAAPYPVPSPDKPIYPGSRSSRARGREESLPEGWVEAWSAVFDAEPGAVERRQLAAWGAEQPCSLAVLRYALLTAKSGAKAAGARVAYARAAALSPPPGIEPYDWQPPPPTPLGGSPEIRPGPMDQSQP